MASVASGDRETSTSTAAATDKAASHEDSIEELRLEIEQLKTRLEEERKKLNDVSCKCACSVRV